MATSKVTSMDQSMLSQIRALRGQGLTLTEIAEIMNIPWMWVRNASNTLIRQGQWPDLPVR